MRFAFRSSLSGHNGLAVHSRFILDLLQRLLPKHQVDVVDGPAEGYDLTISNHMLSLCQEGCPTGPVVQFVHNSYPFLLERGVTHEQVQSAVSACQALWFVSRAVRDEFLSAFDLDAAKCQVVPNCSRFEVPERPRRRVRPPRRAVYVGSIQKRKGFELLCDMAPLEVPVDVYGTPSDRELAGRLERCRGVRLRGTLDHRKLGRRLMKYDCILLFSHAEGSPYVLIEAASLGIPAFCSDVNGNKEIVIDGVTGNTFSHSRGDFRAKWREFLNADMEDYSAKAFAHYSRCFSRAAAEQALASALTATGLFPELDGSREPPPAAETPWCD